MALSCFLGSKCSGQRVMDTPVPCPLCVVCVLNLCRLFPTISCHKDGLNLSRVLKSCNALGICHILNTAIAMEGFPCMTPGCELLMPGRRNSSGGNTAGQSLGYYTHFLFPSVQSRKLKRNPTLRKSHRSYPTPCLLTSQPVTSRIPFPLLQNTVPKFDLLEIYGPHFTCL